jgi:hypothetical protein
VLIGEVGGAGGGGGVAGGGAGAAAVAAVVDVAQELPPAAKVEVLQVVSMLEAAATGAPFVHDPATCPICSKSIS